MSLGFAAANGCFIEPNFLSPTEVALLRRHAASQAVGRKAPVMRRTASGFAPEVDERVKLAELLELSPEIDVATRIAERFEEIGEALDRPLSSFEFITMFRYRTGSFCSLHTDRTETGPDHDEHGALSPSGRQANVVISLSTPGVDYVGGELVLYCLDRPPFAGRGLPLRLPAGALIGFRPEMWHEVRPIESGERLSMVGVVR